MKAIDFLFVLNYKRSGRDVAYSMLFFVIACLAMGALNAAGHYGVELQHVLIRAYPFDFTDSARSFLNKKAGVAVFYVLPLILLGYFFFSRKREKIVLVRYEWLKCVPTSFAAGYSVLLIVALFSVVMVFREAGSIFGFFVQIIVVLLFEYVIFPRIEAQLFAQYKNGH